MYSQGLWIHDPVTRLPHTTVFGSSNFGVRSRHRDLELVVSLKTSDRGLQEALGREVQGIRDHVGAVDRLELANRCPLWLRGLTKLFVRRFL